MEDLVGSILRCFELIGIYPRRAEQKLEALLLLYMNEFGRLTQLLGTRMMAGNENGARKNPTIPGLSNTRLGSSCLVTVSIELYRVLREA
jgi:hypothetical protein